MPPSRGAAARGGLSERGGGPPITAANYVAAISVLFGVPSVASVIAGEYPLGSYYAAEHNCSFWGAG
jgi:hypothetical protein